MLHDQAWPGFDEAKETIVITQLGVIGGQLFPTEQRNIVKLLIEKVLQAAASSVRDVGLQSSNNRGISLREKNLIKIAPMFYLAMLRRWSAARLAPTVTRQLLNRPANVGWAYFLYVQPTATCHATRYKC